MVLVGVLLPIAEPFTATDRPSHSNSASAPLVFSPPALPMKSTPASPLALLIHPTVVSSSLVWIVPAEMFPHFFAFGRAFFERDRNFALGRARERSDGAARFAFDFGQADCRELREPARRVERRGTRDDDFGRRCGCRHHRERRDESESYNCNAFHSPTPLPLRSYDRPLPPV